MPLLNLDTLRTPNTVTIFVQPPGRTFVALLLSNVGIPLEGRARLDLADTEDLRRTWSVTRNPVERLVAQNRIRDPDQLTLTGMLSAHPLISVLAPISIARPDKRELAKLRKILESALSFIVTPERFYANMSCVLFQESYDKTTGKGVNLTLSFEEIQIATPGLVESTLDLDNLGVGASTTNDLGPTSATPVEDPFASGTISGDGATAILGSPL